MTGEQPDGRVHVRNKETLAVRFVLASEVSVLGDAWEQITAAQAAATHGMGYR